MESYGKNEHEVDKLPRLICIIFLCRIAFEKYEFDRGASKEEFKKINFDKHPSDISCYVFWGFFIGWVVSALKLKRYWIMKTLYYPQK